MRIAAEFIGIALTAVSLTTQASEVQRIESGLAEAMQLNRTGRWKEAAALSDRIAATPGISELQEARALWNAGAAYSRSGYEERAAARIQRLNALIPHLPKEHKDHWIVRETEELAKSLAERKSGKHPLTFRHELEVLEDGFWKLADESVRTGLAELSSRFEAIGRAGGGDAGLLVRDGRIIHEWKSDRYRYPMHAMSSTKSITVILVGMLCDDGKLSVDQRVGEFLPEWNEGPRAQVTIHHLLSHTSGLANRAGLGQKGVGGVADKNHYVRDLALDDPVGSQFSYSNEGVQLLSPILDAAAGIPIQDYATERLFKPLGMRNSRLNTDLEGHAWTYADMETTPRDLARIGLLMLDRGRWQGERIVSEDWVQACTRPSQRHNPSCGYLWWLFDGGFAALGYLETDIHVFPKTRTIAVRMQSKPGPDERNPGSTYRRAIIELLGGAAR